jgi:transposase
MMGSQDDRQDRLFYNFRLEDHVPEDHLLRRIDALLDLGSLREHLAPYYSHTGRPSIDPELLIRMLIVGYCYGIRSERQLCEEVRLNLAYRWFCRLSIEDAVPDHSTFSKTRHGRFRESEALRYVFEQCMTEGLVGGVGFAVDASTVRADASRQTFMDRDDDDDWPRPSGGSRPVKEYLATHRLSWRSVNSDCPRIHRPAPAIFETLAAVGRPVRSDFGYSALSVSIGSIIAARRAGR